MYSLIQYVAFIDALDGAEFITFIPPNVCPACGFAHTMRLSSVLIEQQPYLFNYTSWCHHEDIDMYHNLPHKVWNTYEAVEAAGIFDMQAEAVI